MDDIPQAPASRPDLAATWAKVAEMEQHSSRAYRAAARRIRQQVAAYPYIGLAELAEIQRLIDAELKQLEHEQNRLLFAGMLAAAAAAILGIKNARANPAADRLLVRHLIDIPQKDGLNLSARLWRIHAGAAQDMKSIVDVAVQRGWDAEHALRHAMDITPELKQALDEAGSAAVAKRLEAGLLTEPGNAAMKFRRVLRTEINRAHGERYKQMVRDDPDAVGLRFMLSPRHPRVDICDTHASADLYGLGPGVYPVDACPWPAHPNTFSYVEAVYRDDVGTPNPSVRTKADAADFTSVEHESFGTSYRHLESRVAELKAQGASVDNLRQTLGGDKRWIGASLSAQQQNWLRTTAKYVLISDDTLIKQFAHHAGQPVFFSHYRNLQELLDGAQLVVKSRGNSVAFFRSGDDIMKAVLKTTQDGKEVYLSTLFRTNAKEWRRAAQRKEAVFKNEHGSL